MRALGGGAMECAELSTPSPLCGRALSLGSRGTPGEGGASSAVAALGSPLSLRHSPCAVLAAPLTALALGATAPRGPAAPGMGRYCAPDDVDEVLEGLEGAEEAKGGLFAAAEEGEAVRICAPSDSESEDEDDAGGAHRTVKGLPAAAEAVRAVEAARSALQAPAAAPLSPAEAALQCLGGEAAAEARERARRWAWALEVELQEQLGEAGEQAGVIAGQHAAGLEHARQRAEDTSARYSSARGESRLLLGEHRRRVEERAKVVVGRLQAQEDATAAAEAARVEAEVARRKAEEAAEAQRRAAEEAAAREVEERARQAKAAEAEQLAAQRLTAGTVAADGAAARPPAAGPSAAAAGPSAAAAGPSATVDAPKQKGTEDRVAVAAVKRRDDLKAALKAATEAAAPLKADASKKMERRRIDKAIIQHVVQLTGTQQQVAAKSKALCELIAAAPTEAHRAYVVLQAAGKALIQAEEQVRRLESFAFPLAELVACVARVAPSFGPVLLARLHARCPASIPLYVPYTKERFASEVDYQRAMGYRVTRGDEGKPDEVETQDDYNSRMYGLMCLYGAMMGSGRGAGMAPADAWRWLAAALNALPQNREVANAVLAVLRTCGYQLWRAYGDHAVRLFATIGAEFVPRLSGQGQQTSVVAARLSAYLEDQKFREEPEGYTLPATDESSQYTEELEGSGRAHGGGGGGRGGWGSSGGTGGGGSGGGRGWGTAGGGFGGGGFGSAAGRGTGGFGGFGRR